MYKQRTRRAPRRLQSPCRRRTSSISFARPPERVAASAAGLGEAKKADAARRRADACCRDTSLIDIDTPRPGIELAAGNANTGDTLGRRH